MRHPTQVWNLGNWFDPSWGLVDADCINLQAWKPLRFYQVRFCKSCVRQAAGVSVVSGLDPCNRLQQLPFLRVKILLDFVYFCSFVAWMIIPTGSTWAQSCQPLAHQVGWSAKQLPLFWTGQEPLPTWRGRRTRQRSAKTTGLKEHKEHAWTVWHSVGWPQRAIGFCRLWIDGFSNAFDSKTLSKFKTCWHASNCLSWAPVAGHRFGSSISSSRAFLPCLKLQEQVHPPNVNVGTSLWFFPTVDPLGCQTLATTIALGATPAAMTGSFHHGSTWQGWQLRGVERGGPQDFVSFMVGDIIQNNLLRGA